MKHSEYITKIESDPEYQKGQAALKTHFVLGDAVVRARIKKGWSQAELAEKVGTKQANISRLEAALGNPTLKLINKILQVLELDINIVSSLSTNSYKTISFEPGIPVNNWPSRAKSNSKSTQSTGKLS